MVKNTLINGEELLEYVKTPENCLNYLKNFKKEVTEDILYNNYSISYLKQLNEDLYYLIPYYTIKYDLKESCRLNNGYGLYNVFIYYIELTIKRLERDLNG